MKKLACLTLAILMMLSMSITAFAAENDAETEDRLSKNYHVSTVNPLNQISTYGTSQPTTAWDVVRQGPYSFSGQAQYSKLYLSNLLYGTSRFKVHVENKSASSTLTVNPHDSINLNPFDVSPNNTRVMKYELQHGKIYFLLSFNAPSNFSGTVYEWVYQ